jgi:hypothetical protein
MGLHHLITTVFAYLLLKSIKYGKEEWRKKNAQRFTPNFPIDALKSFTYIRRDRAPKVKNII